MGEIADMILEGELCQYCGVYLDDSRGEFPQSCKDCEKEADRDDKESKRKKKGGRV